MKRIWFSLVVLYSVCGSLRAGAAAVLVVDDSAEMRSLITEFVSRAVPNATVVLASSRSEAVQQFFSNPAQFVLVITDLHMAACGTGLELATELSALRADLPIILHSAAIPAEWDEQLGHFTRQAKAAGIYHLLRKPAKLAEFRAIVQGLIAAPVCASELRREAGKAGAESP